LADEVEIVNFGEGGVASEATLASLTRAIERLAASTGKDPKTAAGKLQELHNKRQKTSIDLLDEFNDEKPKETKATKNATDALSAFSNRLRGAAMGAIGSALGSFTNFGQELIMGGSQLSDFSRHIPIIGGKLSVLTSFVDETMVAFRELSSSGAGFNNSLGDIRRAAAGSFMSLNDFTNFIVNNSDKLAAFGGTVTNGANQIVRLNKALGSQRDDLLNMGFSYEEINDSLVNYAFLTRQQGRLESRNTAEVAANAAEYAKTLQTLSKLTGEDVDAIRDRQAQQMNDFAFQQMLRGKTEQEQARIASLMAEAELAGPAAVSRLKEILLELPPMTEETQAFAIASRDANRSLERSASLISDTTMSQDQFNKAISGNTAQMLAGMIEGAEDMQSVLAVASRTGDGFGAQVLQNIQNAGMDLTRYIGMSGDELINAIEADMESARRQADQRDELTAAAAEFEQSVRNSRQAIQEQFLNSGVFEQLYGKMAEFATYLGSDEVIGEMEAFVQSLTTLGSNIMKDFETLGFAGTVEKYTELAMEKVAELISKAFQPGGPIMNAISSGVGLIIDGIGAAIKGLWESAPVVTALVGAIGTLFAAKKVVDIANGTRRLLGYEDTGRRARSPSTTPGNIRGSRGRGVGAQLAGLGRGIGAGLGGMAGGIIRGISSALAFAGGLASPIALGAGAIGLAILAIGSGIAGATWLTGAALPKFAEGMQSFTDLDGRALKSAALGITAISGALVAFGAANVVSAIGNIAGDILNGINSLFGGTTPFEKLEEFSTLNIDSVKVQQNARALAAFGEAMGSLNLGSSGFSNMMANLFDGITSFFGGSTGLPIDQINEFARYNLDSEKFRSNADAIIAFGEGMSAISGIRLGSSFTNMVSALFDGITTIFGGSVQLPYQQMIEFGEQDLDQDAITGNAEVLKAFGEALSSVPKIDKERSGGLFGAVAYIFRGGVQLPWDKMVAFGEVDLDETAITGNAEVLKAFGEALSSVPDINAERTGGLFGGIASVFAGGVEMPWDHLREFGNIRGINKTGIEDNAESLRIFGTALQGFPEINAERVGGFFGSLATIFSGSVEYPWDKVKEFGAELLDPNGNVIPNATTISNFASAMSSMPNVETSREGGLLGLLTGLLVGWETMPWDAVKKFGAELLDPNDIIVANVEVLNSFAEAMGNMPQLSTNREGGALGWVKDIFAGEEDPLAPFAAFGAYSLDATRIANNMSAISSYSNAISEIPAINNTQLSRTSRSLIDFAKNDWDNLVSFGNDITLPSENILRHTSVIQNFATQLNAMPAISTDIDKLIDDINLFTKSGGYGNNFDWDDIATFGNKDFTGVLGNAQIIGDLAASISNLNAAGSSELSIQEDLVARLERVSGLGTGLGHTAESLQTLANVQGLGIQFETIKEGLDTDAVRTYNDAIETLIGTIEDLKDSLGDVSSMQESANTAMSNIQINARNTTEGLGRMGAALDAMISELRVANEYNKEVSRNTKGITGSNVGSGYISKVP